eukprot:sb/3477028/
MSPIGAQQDTNVSNRCPTRQMSLTGAQQDTNVSKRKDQRSALLVLSTGTDRHMSKQPITTRYLGHVTGYQPIRGQYFLNQSVPDYPQCQPTPTNARPLITLVPLLLSLLLS